MQPLWSHALHGRPRGLSLAREKGWLLTRDDDHWLYLLTRDGRRQAQRKPGPQVTAACCADDGSACVAAGGTALWWLAPDLTERWQVSLPAPALAVTVDAFGQYAAVADDRGGLHLYSAGGQRLAGAACPRPVHHLAFAVAAPQLLASADFGFVGCFDLAGQMVWRDGLVAHVGALAVTGVGSEVLLACFSEGVQRYASDGRKLDRLAPAEPARLVSVDFAATRIVIGGLTNRLLLVDSSGRELDAQELERSAVAIALGPLGDYVMLALGDNRVACHQIRRP
jgi:hypothetical protein